MVREGSNLLLLLTNHRNVSTVKSIQSYIYYYLTELFLLFFLFFLFFQKHAGSLVIQTLWRRRVARKSFNLIVESVLLLQTFVRSVLACNIVQRMRKDKASITIQKFLRQKLCRQHFLHVRNSAIVVQSLYRSKIATTLVRTLLYERKEEAKLVNQVAELKRQLAEQSDVATTTSIELVERLKKENLQLRTENEKLTTTKMELESQVRALTAKLINERSVSAATRAETVRKKKRRTLFSALSDDEECFIAFAQLSAGPPVYYSTLRLFTTNNRSLETVQTTRLPSLSTT